MASLTDRRAYHILSYATFLGTTFFQSFVGGPVAFTVLPRPMFGRLQQATFPVFFSIQTVLPMIMLLTYPDDKSALGVRQGIFAESNRWTALYPILAVMVTSAINLVALGPATTKAMKARHHQGADE